MVGTVLCLLTAAGLTFLSTKNQRGHFLSTPAPPPVVGAWAGDEAINLYANRKTFKFFLRFAKVFDIYANRTVASNLVSEHGGRVKKLKSRA